MALNNTGDLDPNDEINHYLRGRMISSMEAFWRIMGYQTYPASDPPVTTIKSKKKCLWKEIIEKNMTCDFDVWLNRPLIFFNIKYEDFFKDYDYSYKCPARYKNSIQDIHEINIEDFTCCVMKVPQVEIIGKFIYLYKLKKIKIIRLQPVNIFCGDDWYFRLLVKNICFTNYEAAKECDGRKYSTYQETCSAYGLLNNENDALIAFNEIVADGTLPNNLRGFFVTLTIQGNNIYI